MCLLQLKGEIKEVFTLEVGFMHLTKGPGKWAAENHSIGIYVKLAGVIKTNINEMYICMYCIRLSLKILGKLGISTLR